jgi:transposase
MTIQPVLKPTTARVIGGVDTHKNTHYAAAVDDQGRFLGHREFRPTITATNSC